MAAALHGGAVVPADFPNRMTGGRVVSGKEREMLSHIRAVGILHIVFSSLTILIGLGLLVMFGGLAALVTVWAPAMG